MRLLKTMLILSCSLAVCMESYAAEGGGGGYGNIMYGISVPDSANTEVHTVYGFSGGSRISNHLSIGGYHTVSSDEVAGGSSFHYKMTGLEARVNVIAAADKNVFIGFRGGVTKVKSDLSGADVVFSPYHFGLSSGYYFRFWKVVSVGFEGSFLEIEESTALNGATPVTYQSFHTISFFGTIGIMF